MTRRLSHRGPDAAGYYFGRRVGFGHRRLAIIDLEGGRQPMFNRERRLHLISNGEIYNYLELRRELEAKGYSFKSQSDTEVLLNLFQEEREDSFRKLEGMFACAFWDDANETLYLARDPFGIKPLYYYQDSAVFIFASEMKALLEYPELNRQLDLTALDQYFGSLALPEPHCVFRKVRKVPAGHFLKVCKNKVRIEPYWQLQFDSSAQPSLSGVQTSELERQLRGQLECTIRLSLRSDVPVGVLLSGGVDSSAITAFASRENGRRLHTFSAAFREDEFNEARFSRLVSKAFGTRHHEVLVTKARATRIASRLAELMDEPFADSSSIPTYAVCELASGYVKTVLSGEGADELFGGYPWHVARSARGGARDAETITEHPARVIFTKLERATLYGECWKNEIGRHRRNNSSSVRTKRRTRLSALHRSLLEDFRIYLPSDILFKSDRVSMIHSLEVRVPFLNLQFAEFALGLPEKMKVNGRRTRKYLLKRAMQGILPEAVLKRPKKGFSIPMDLWLWERGEWREMIYDTIFSRRARERGQFDMRMLEKLQREHERLENFHGYKLWTIFIFEMWQQSFLDGAPAHGGASL